ARSRIEAVAEQDGADRHRRYPYVQLEQLAPDPLVAPPGILGCEAKDEVGGLTGERRPTGLALGLEGPFPPYQLAMPPQERVGPNDEGRPHRPRQSSTGRGEQQSIRAPERRPLRLPAQDLDLMAQHEQFDVAFFLRTLAGPD